MKPFETLSQSPPFAEIVDRRLQRACAALESLRSQAGVVTEIAALVADALHGGGQLLTCGNGGSAAEALHLAEELTGRFEAERPPLRAICLNADPTALTCIANDFGYEEVFARQCRALGGHGDVLLVLSNSGGSPNVVRALEAARELGMRTIGLLGGDGGPARPL
ncbi:MAG: SIS domain-containing protein, partial [Planctomycetota bacterium]|nr:SIS domain-containing protein [Planctomycetota bacterium]